MKVKIIMSLSMHRTKKWLTQKKELVAVLVYYVFKRASTEMIRKISVLFSRASRFVRLNGNVEKIRNHSVFGTTFQHGFLFRMIMTSQD